jgi:hypothetical protein
MFRQCNSVYEFGPFRLDLAEKALLKDWEFVALKPKAFDTLLISFYRLIVEDSLSDSSAKSEYRKHRREIHRRLRESKEYTGYKLQTNDARLMTPINGKTLESLSNDS